MQELGNALQASNVVDVIHEWESGYECFTGTVKETGCIENMSLSEALITPELTWSLIRVVMSEYHECQKHPESIMNKLKRITLDPTVMGGKPCIRGMRVTVGMIIGLMAAGRSQENILEAYPYLEKEDLREALAYAAWRSEEMEIPLVTG